MIKVGDRVIVTEHLYLPDYRYKEGTVFEVVDVPEDGSPILDTMTGGWADRRIGNSLYWHVDEEFLKKVNCTNKIGGKIL